MSEATLTPDPDEAALSRLAALDMAAVKRAHERFMAAAETWDVADERDWGPS